MFLSEPMEDVKEGIGVLSQRAVPAAGTSMSIYRRNLSMR